MTKLHLMNSSALALACAMLLAGCDKQDASAPAATQTSDALPLTTGPQTAIAPAPAAEALPAAPRPQIVAVANPQDDYAYADQAEAMSDAIGDAPPDYGFDYQDTHPWVWRSANRSEQMVEPVQGGYRYYYYQPGASQPYLVRDPQYAYGFSNGQLVAIYDGDGNLLPRQAMDQRADDAGRYLARAVALYEAAQQSERRAVNAANWAAERAELDAARARWQAQQNQQAAWRAYHDAHAAQDQAYWQGEQAGRRQAAQAFNDWSARGYNGPPPPVANRVNVQQQDIDQARKQQAQQDAAHQAQGGAQQRQVEQARQQQAQQDAAHQAQAKSQQQQVEQARQQQAQQDAAHQAQAGAQQRQVEQARQQQAQQDAAHQAQAKAQQQQADQARQQQAQQDAAHQAQAKAQQQQADQARQQQAQAKDAADSNRRGQRGGRDKPVAAPAAAAAAAPAPAAPVPAVAVPAAKPPAAPVPAAAQTPPVRPRGKGRPDHRDDTPPPQ